MAKFDSKMEKLKEILLSCDDFRDVYDYFFDHLTNHPEFMKMGRKSKDPFLKSALKAIGGQIFKEEVKITRLLITKIAKYSFYHGPCFINGIMSSVIFFKDIDMGMISMVMPSSDGEVKFIRFSSVQMKDKPEGDLFVSPMLNKTIH
jgi:hypothetical protein